MYMTHFSRGRAYKKTVTDTVRIDIIVIVIGIAVHIDTVFIVIENAIAITPTVIDGVAILIAVALATAS